jgi:hypothetical protein
MISEPKTMGVLTPEPPSYSRLRDHITLELNNIMVSFMSIVTAVLAVANIAIAKPTPKLADQPVLHYLGTQGPVLCTIPILSYAADALTLVKQAVHGLPRA